jgi:orotate phosphoribosyltransferase
MARSTMGDNMSHNTLIKILKEKSVKIGEFTLASGKQSNFYVDARQTTLSSEGALVIADLILDRLNDEVVGVGGPVTGADPIVGATILRAAQMGRSLSGFMVRKKLKAHGTGNWVEGLGNLPPGSKVCMIEDTVTTAGSLVTAIHRAEECGLEVVQCISVVDRQEGAFETMTSSGYPFETLTTKEDLM